MIKLKKIESLLAKSAMISVPQSIGRTVFYLQIKFTILASRA